MPADRALLSGLIDHAPLFPPASLPLEEALEDHRRAHASPHSWMVARFVCPASRLSELDGEPLRLSIVADREAGADEVAAVRRTRFVSIGSCSFTEPVEELEALGWL